MRHRETAEIRGRGISPGRSARRRLCPDRGVAAGTRTGARRRGITVLASRALYGIQAQCAERGAALRTAGLWENVDREGRGEFDREKARPSHRQRNPELLPPREGAGIAE